MNKYTFMLLLLLSTNISKAQNCFSIINLPDTFIKCPGASYQTNPALQNISNFVMKDTFWTPNLNISNANILNPLISGNTPYVLTLVGLSTQNQVVNGDFSAGPTNFSTDYIPGTGGPWGLLSDTGQYAITTNPNLVHTNFASFGDHTTGNGNMLVVNGAGTLNVNVWCQTVNVTPFTDYQFSTWASSADPGSPAILQFNINGTPVGAPFFVSPVTGLWQEFSTTWNSGSSTTAVICITNQNTAQGGNDFCLDDISLSKYCTVSDTISFVVPQVTCDFTYTQQASCDIDTFVFSASNLPSTYDSLVWNFGDGSTAYGANVSHQYNANGNYQVTLYIYASGCSNLAQHTVSYIQTPATTVAALITDVKCFGLASGIINLNISGGIAPYEVSLNGGAYNSNVSFQNLQAGSYTFTLKSALGCITNANFEITQPNAPLDAIVNISAGFCDQLQGKAIASGIGGTDPYTYAWYDPALTLGNTYNAGYSSKNVLLIVQDANNCVDSSTQIIPHYACCDLKVPNAFSPNHDNRNDDIRCILSPNTNIETYSFDVYDRWGQQVFHSNDPKQAWDGYFKERELEAGIYMYTVQFKCLNSDERLKKQGDILLTR